MEVISRRSGRRKGAVHGALRAAVLSAVQEEDRTNPLTDLAVAAAEGISEAAISQARRALAMPVARQRAVSYGKGMRVGEGIAHCIACMEVHEVPKGHGSVECPQGHGRVILSSYRLVFPR